MAFVTVLVATFSSSVVGLIAFNVVYITSKTLTYISTGMQYVHI